MVIAGGATGGLIAGGIATEYDKSKIQKELREQYGIDVKEIKAYNMDKMPEEVWSLCSDYFENQDKQSMYMDLTARAYQMAMLMCLAEGVYQLGMTLEQYFQNKKDSSAQVSAGAMAGNKGESGALLKDKGGLSTTNNT